MNNIFKVMFVGLVIFLAVSQRSEASIFVSHDVNTFGTLAAGDQEKIFAANVANYLTTGSATKNLLLYESNPGDPTRDWDIDVLTYLSLSGYNVTKTADYSTPFSSYDAIFVAQDFPTVAFLNNNLMIDYVNNGGGVYLAGGAGSHLIPSAPATEAAGWSTFLNHYGLAFEENFNNIFAVPITSTDPVFNGITSIKSGNGQSIIDLGTNPSAKILQRFGDENIYARIDVERSNVVPEPGTLFLLGSGLIGFMSTKLRRRKTEELNPIV